MRTIVDELLRPIVRRISSNLGTLLAALGVASGDITIVLAAVPVLIGLVVDLALSYLERRAR